ncbi:MAG: DUF4870 domain-containing protein [Candidatus Moranbacteria bacterium]|nr:DUF4870 domain-containing protein [Candidatus Moranbacteria bacterium]
MEGQQTNSSDAEKNKAMAIVGYIIPILFFIPLVNESSKNSPFAKFHANQQLNFLIFTVVGYIVSTILMFVIIGIFLWVIVVIMSIVFLIMGIINAANGTMKKLPIIGGFQIIK